MSNRKEDFNKGQSYTYKNIKCTVIDLLDYGVLVDFHDGWWGTFYFNPKNKDQISTTKLKP